MTDLLHIVPSFPTKLYTHLLPSLEKNLISTTDLLSLDALEIAKRAQLPLLDVRRLANHVLKALQGDLGLGEVDREDGKDGTGQPAEEARGGLRKSGRQIVERWNTISTLNGEFDAALGGGIPTGYITEITGESGAGKTQFLLTLLLTAQLAPPHGVSRPTLYISTESALSTPRLSQLLTTHPHLSALPRGTRPTLDRVLSIQTPDLETQDHILTYQLPVAIVRHNIGLVVLDSVAANYRAEFSNHNGQPGTGTGTGRGVAMAQRSAELVRLGQLLRSLARMHDVAIVVANQVTDRFAPILRHGPPSRPSSYHMLSSPPPPPSSSLNAPPSSTPTDPASDQHNRTSISKSSSGNLKVNPNLLTLDHQQRFFTGWGDVPVSPTSTFFASTEPNLKTPALGLSWTNQVACRIALIKEPIHDNPSVFASTRVFHTTASSTNTHPEQRQYTDETPAIWRRYMKVVFAPWVRGAEGAEGSGVEFEITAAGLSTRRDGTGDGNEDGSGVGTMQEAEENRRIGEGMIGR